VAEDQGKAVGGNADEPVPGAADELAAIPDYAEGFDSLAKFDDADASVEAPEVKAAGEPADAEASEDEVAYEQVPEELAEDDESEPADDDEPEDALITEAEQIAASVASARPVRKKAPEAEGKAGAKKGRPTAKQDRPAKSDEGTRVGPITFVKQSIDELKKVNWPSLDQWQQYFVVVLVFVLIVIAYVGLLDLGLGVLLLKIFGDA